MSEEKQQATEASPAGCAFSVTLLFVPGVVGLAFDRFTGEDWPFALFYGLLFALPFGYLALEGFKTWLPWVVAAVVTACFWGALIASALSSVWDRTGVNFGMGLLMLASPFVVTACAWIAVQIARHPRA